MALSANLFPCINSIGPSALLRRTYSISTKFPPGVGPGSSLISKLGVRAPLPQLSVTPAVHHRPTTPHSLLRHLSALLTKEGQRGEPLVSSVNAKLRLRYGVDNPIQIAIDAVKPVIKYYKSKITRRFVPLALYPRNAEAMAMRWIIEQANGKSYIGGRADIERALVDEFDSVIQGTSTLYMKRFNTHRNPN